MIDHYAVIIDNKDGTYDVLVSDVPDGNKCDEVKKLLAGTLRYVGPMVSQTLEIKDKKPRTKCYECYDTKQVGWGLTREGKAYATVPCIMCDREGYEAAVAKIMDRLRRQEHSSTAR
jgi:hypothetical protein